MEYFFDLVIDDVGVVLNRLGSQASKPRVPQRGLHPNLIGTCSNFTYDKVIVIPNLAAG